MIKEFCLGKDELKERFPIGSVHMIDGKACVVKDIYDSMPSNCMASYPLVEFEEAEKGLPRKGR